MNYLTMLTSLEYNILTFAINLTGKLNNSVAEKLFAPVTPTFEIAGYSQRWVKENRNF